jgi:hypothetical protein
MTSGWMAQAHAIVKHGAGATGWGIYLMTSTHLQNKEAEEKKSVSKDT